MERPAHSYIAYRCTASEAHGIRIQCMKKKTGPLLDDLHAKRSLFPKEGTRFTRGRRAPGDRLRRIDRSAVIAQSSQTRRGRIFIQSAVQMWKFIAPRKFEMSTRDIMAGRLDAINLFLLLAPFSCGTIFSKMTLSTGTVGTRPFLHGHAFR